MVEVETPTASPFASSLLFDYVATYMYEGDTPNAERRAAALALDRDLLRELLGQEELRELIDPEALDEVEDSLQQPDRGRAIAKDRDALQQVLRRLGDLTLEECRAAGRARAIRPSRCWRSWSRSAARRKVRVARRGALHRRRGRGPLPRRPRRAAAGRPARQLPRSRSRTRCSRWSVATPPPTAPSPPASSPTATGSTRPRRSASSRARAMLVRGELLPGGTEREWCDADVLRRVRRASLAQLRKEVEAADRQPARPLPAELAERRRPSPARAPAPTACARRWSRCREWR